MPSSDAADDARAGDRVEAIFANDGTWYPAVVVNDYSDGTLDVRWDDPDGGPAVSRCGQDNVRKLAAPMHLKGPVVGQAEEAAAPSSDADALRARGDAAPPPSKDTNPLEIGDTVEAIFGDDGQWYPGVVVKDNGDGTIDVRWDDPDGGPEVSTCGRGDVLARVPLIPLEDLEIGQKYRGTVYGVTNFGVFVDIGAEVNGLVHISAIRDGFVDNVEDAVQYGQEVDVWVKGVKDSKLSLVMVESKLKSASARAGRRIDVADLSQFAEMASDVRLSARVVSVAAFGAFVTVSPPGGGVEAQGLVRIEDMRDGHVEDIYAEVAIGQELDVYVKECDLAIGRLVFSMRPLA